MQDCSAEKAERERQLYGLLERKVTLCHHYFHLTQKIRQVFDRGDREKLRAAVSERRSAAKKVDRIDSALKKIFQNGRIDLSLVSQNIKQHLEHQMQKIQQVMAAIEPIDRELVVLVASETEELKSNLLRMRRIQKANAGYGRQRPAVSKFINVRN